MKAISTVALAVMLACPASFGQVKADAPVRPAAAAAKVGALEGLVRPEVVVRFAAELGLSAEQQQAMRQEVQTARLKLAEAQRVLQTEMAALNALVEKRPVNEEEAVAQLDKVLNAEREIKRTNLALALSIMSKLTPEQLEKAQTLAKDPPKSQERPAGGANKEANTQALRTKMQEVQAAAQKKQAEGKDITTVKRLVESVRPLVQEGKLEEAMNALDRAAKMLE